MPQGAPRCSPRHGHPPYGTGVAPRVVVEILGHSQISITMDVYTHVVQDGA